MLFLLLLFIYLLLYTGASIEGDRSSSSRRSLLSAVCDDEVTSVEEWNEMARLCRERGYNDCAAELLSSVATASAAKNGANEAHNEHPSEVHNVEGEHDEPEPPSSGDATTANDN